MTSETRHDTSPQGDLYQAAEAAIASGRTQRVAYKGATLTIGRLQPRQGRTPRRRAAALTPAEREAILEETFGGWKGLIDADQLKRDLNELQRDESEPRSL